MVVADDGRLGAEAIELQPPPRRGRYQLASSRYTERLGQPTGTALLPQAVTVPRVFDLKDDDRQDGRHHDRCGQCGH